MNERELREDVLAVITESKVKLAQMKKDATQEHFRFMIVWIDLQV